MPRTPSILARRAKRPTSGAVAQEVAGEPLTDIDTDADDSDEDFAVEE